MRNHQADSGLPPPGPEQRYKNGQIPNGGDHEQNTINYNHSESVLIESRRHKPRRISHHLWSTVVEHSGSVLAGNTRKHFLPIFEHCIGFQGLKVPRKVHISTVAIHLRPFAVVIIHSRHVKWHFGSLRAVLYNISSWKVWKMSQLELLNHTIRVHTVEWSRAKARRARIPKAQVQFPAYWILPLPYIIQYTLPFHTPLSSATNDRILGFIRR